MDGFPMWVQLGTTGLVAPVASQTFQIVGPWGQTQAALVWEEALNQMFTRSSKNSGRQGNFWENGTTNGWGTTPRNGAHTGCTFTNGSPTVTGIASTADIILGALCFCSVAGLVGIAYVIGVPSSTSITMNQNFGGTTGSYTLTLAAPVISSANDIISTP